MVRARISGLAMAPHITTHDPVVSPKSRHPVVPELGAAADAMLEPHCLLFGHPGIGVVIDLVVHVTIIGFDGRHGWSLLEELYPRNTGLGKSSEIRGLFRHDLAGSPCSRLH